MQQNEERTSIIRSRRAAPPITQHLPHFFLLLRTPFPPITHHTRISSQQTPAHYHRQSTARTSQVLRLRSHLPTQCPARTLMVSYQTLKTPICNSNKLWALPCNSRTRPSNFPHTPVRSKTAIPVGVLWTLEHISPAPHGRRPRALQTHSVSRNISTSTGFPMRTSIIGDTCLSTLGLETAEHLANAPLLELYLSPYVVCLFSMF